MTGETEGTMTEETTGVITIGEIAEMIEEAAAVAAETEAVAVEIEAAVAVEIEVVVEVETAVEEQEDKFEATSRELRAVKIKFIAEELNAHS